MGKIGRRAFLKSAAGAVGAVSQIGAFPAEAAAVPAELTDKKESQGKSSDEIAFPRKFSGGQLKTISFPLGGVGAGSLGLGGRGQLRDWEIFNRPNQGYAPQYGFPAIWVQDGSAPPIARVLESRILPPYEGQDGLGSQNAPGLSRIASATFTGAYPLAHIRFEDEALPVEVELEAFSPFIPHNPDDSGLPVAILRYLVKNPGRRSVKVSVAFSVENPVKSPRRRKNSKAPEDHRVNEHRTSGSIEGLMMTHPGLPEDDPMSGSFALAVVSKGPGTTYWRGWPKGGWWNSPMLFWDAFSRDGRLAEEPSERTAAGSLCRQETIAPGKSAAFTFFLAWHFPNRTPEWCGWGAPPGEEKTVIGNHYCTRFRDAWEAADYTAKNLAQLEAKTRAFSEAFASSTLPGAVKDAASANLSTLASTTCFRTADGMFHGFEGSDDQAGCCFGNCTHVWNYETATAYLFPSFARSLREAAFGYSMYETGAMGFRQYLPDGVKRLDVAAADGQMGQIVHGYMDWKLSGDEAWLRRMWPRFKKGLEFSWVPGGWDGDRDGVFEGVQHNTYDVEFYGPNPMCSVYYLAALRASEEMAQAVGDQKSAVQYRDLYERGRRWVDENLFEQEFYIQQVRGYRADQIAQHLRSTMGSGDTEHPQYQVGSGCLADQLIGQYLAHVAGLGNLVSGEHIRAALASIYRYNYKRSLADHDCIERTYALNDEAAVVICDYGKRERPRIPFPYYAEAWTGIEYAVASLMLYAGMIPEAIECITQVRARYDGIKRNPWDEPECGHHYARAMSSWSAMVALSGFRYEGDRQSIAVIPPMADADFHCFWATATGWGKFHLKRRDPGTHLSIEVLDGELPLRSCALDAAGSKAAVRKQSEAYEAKLDRSGARATLHLSKTITVREGERLEVEVHG